MRSINRTVGLCLKTKNVAFISPEIAPEHSINAARKLCSVCPLLRSCAEDALTAGNSLDGNVVQAACGVLQAGVICRGDGDTAQALAAIAQVPVPAYRKKRARNHAPSNCVECGAGMVPWSREGAPEGKVMAYARGHCVNCRSAYNALRAREGETVALRKPAPPRGRRRTPDHCADCERPMIPGSHPKREGFVKHYARGLCRTCNRRSHEARKAERSAA